MDITRIASKPNYTLKTSLSSLTFTLFLQNPLHTLLCPNYFLSPFNSNNRFLTRYDEYPLININAELKVAGQWTSNDDENKKWEKIL